MTQMPFLINKTHSVLTDDLIGDYITKKTTSEFIIVLKKSPLYKPLESNPFILLYFFILEFIIGWNIAKHWFQKELYIIELDDKDQAATLFHKIKKSVRWSSEIQYYEIPRDSK